VKKNRQIMFYVVIGLKFSKLGSFVCEKNSTSDVLFDIVSISKKYIILLHF
jgi:hypothetical protein